MHDCYTKVVLVAGTAAGRLPTHPQVISMHLRTVICLSAWLECLPSDSIRAVIPLACVVIKLPNVFLSGLSAAWANAHRLLFTTVRKCYDSCLYFAFSQPMVWFVRSWPLPSQRGLARQWWLNQRPRAIPSSSAPLR